MQFHAFDWCFQQSRIHSLCYWWTKKSLWRHGRRCGFAWVRLLLLAALLHTRWTLVSPIIFYRCSHCASSATASEDLSCATSFLGRRFHSRDTGISAVSAWLLTASRSRRDIVRLFYDSELTVIANELAPCRAVHCCHRPSDPRFNVDSAAGRSAIFAVQCTLRLSRKRTWRRSSSSQCTFA